MNSKERLIFDCIDAHTQGNPVRLVKGPKPKLKGSSMGEKRIHFINEFDLETNIIFPLILKNEKKNDISQALSLIHI